MPKPLLFVSCGQRTIAEKHLADEICKIIAADNHFTYFFAEFQHSLSGLNENILDALADATGFISVMHGRGQVSYGDPQSIALTRASVWIEQEIAIAAFIQRALKKTLLTAAYIEDGVGREGIRDLLHLNPTPFKVNDEVLTDLKNKLATWRAPLQKSMPEDEYGKLELRHVAGYESGFRVVQLTAVMTNKGPRVKEYACALDVPTPLLAWSGSTVYNGETKSGRPGYRRFRFTEADKQNAPILKNQSVDMFKLAASITDLREGRADVLRQAVYVSAEMEARSYELAVPCSEVFPIPDPSA